MPPNNLEASTMQKEKLTEKQQFWQGHIEAQGRSGLTRRAYCQQHSLAMQQMSYFRAYFKKRSMPAQDRGGFVKVPLPPVAAAQMTIRLASGVCVECPADAKLVSEVLRSLS
jgi:hypothetical protein